MVHVPLMFVSEWRKFPLALSLAKKKKILMTTRIFMFLKSPASPDMLPFSLCNKKRLAIQHMNRPLFPPTLLIPSYDIGKYIGLRSYQHPLVAVLHRITCWRIWLRHCTASPTVADSISDGVIESIFPAAQRP